MCQKFRAIYNQILKMPFSARDPCNEKPRHEASAASGGGVLSAFRLQVSSLFQASGKLGKLYQFVGVAPLVVVPGNDLNEIVVQGNSGLGVKN
jgi:hypothetical protein